MTKEFHDEFMQSTEDFIKEIHERYYLQMERIRKKHGYPAGYAYAEEVMQELTKDMYYRFLKEMVKIYTNEYIYGEWKRVSGYKGYYERKEKEDGEE